MLKFNKFVLVGLVCLSVVSVFFSGCGPSTGSKGSSGEKTITFANTTDISSMDPRNANSTAMATILSHIYNGLLTTDEKGNVIPDLAESYKQIDATTWEFTLRKGVTFQDGSKLTADDVKYTLDTIADPAKKFRLKADFDFMHAEVIDAEHVRIKTDAPNAAFPLRLTYVKIIPKAYVEKVGDAEFAQKPIGTGPFSFVEWKKGDRLVMKANDKYFGGVPKIKQVVFRVIPEAASRIAALESGEVDIAATIPTSEVKRLQDKKNIKVLGGPTTRVVYIGMNLKNSEPLRNQKVRQAMNYAIDRDAIITGVLDGYGTKIATISTPEYEGYDVSVTPYEYNPAKAKQLLAEAGYADGFKLDFSATDASMNGTDVVQAIAGQLANVGIICNVSQEEPNQQRDKISSGQVAPLYISGVGGPYSNIDLVAKLGFSTGERYSTFSNQSFDALRKEAITSSDKGQRDKLNSDLQKMSKDLAPAIFLWQQQVLYAYNSDRVIDWIPRVDEMIVVTGADVK
jgi:peptide/nickel transport system substrate-binding protein